MIKIRRKIPESWYCGSLIQQNHGESTDKGFLIWEIEDKNTFKIRKKVLKNQEPYLDILVTPDGIEKPTETPPKRLYRVRLVSDYPLTLKALEEAKKQAKKFYNPISINYLDRSGKHSTDLSLETYFSAESLKDHENQENLIFEFLKDNDLNIALVEDLFRINREIDSRINDVESTTRNTSWNIEQFKWDNLFNYGEDNFIDFRKLNGIVGIFGKSFTGKSSVFDSILYTIFNGIAKRSFKNSDIINDEKEKSSSEIIVNFDGKKVKINRTSEKYRKKNKVEAKGNVDFYVNNVCENGLDRNETDKRIKHMFGTIDDFLLTSMIPQFDSLSFINEGSTKKRNIIARFLNLEMFEKKYSLAKEESQDLKSFIKKNKEIDFASKISDSTEKVILIKEQIEEKKNEFTKQDEKINELRIDIGLLKKDALISENKNTRTIEQLKDDFQILFLDKKEKEGQISILKSEIDILKTNIKTNTDTMKQFVGVRYLKTFQEIIEKQLSNLESQILTNKVELKSCQKNVLILGSIPCGTKFRDCKFIKNSFVSQELIEPLQSKIDSNNSKKQKLTLLKSKIENLLKLPILEEKKIFLLGKQILSKNNELEFVISQLKTVVEKIDNLKKEIDWSKKNSKAIMDFEKLKNLQTIFDAKIWEKSELTKKIETLSKELGSQESNKKVWSDRENEHKDNLRKFEAYELYMKCMHSSGISYFLLKKKLPLINQEIQNILSEIVDFSIKFEAEEKKLNVLICRSGKNPRIITSGSGAEQAIASIALTLALKMMSTMPQSDIFILDEPISSLDDDLKTDFINLLNYIKNKFKTVFLITHLDFLKDVVDKELTIENIDGFARLNTERT